MKFRVPGVSIYKRKAKSAKDDPYLLAWYEDGRRQYLVAHPEREVMLEIAWSISRRITRKKHGLIDPNETKQIRAAQTPLKSLLEDYQSALLAREDTAKHANLYHQRLARITKRAKAHCLPELTPAKVQQAVKLFVCKRPAKDGKFHWGKPLSAQTRNHYLTAVVCFFQWLKEEGLIPINRMADALARYNVKNDRKVIRRILDEELLAKLIWTAETGPVFEPPRQKNRSIDGPTRADVYRVCIAIGARAGDLRELRVRNLRLDESIPGIVLEGRYAKNRLESYQTIDPHLAHWLQRYTAGKAPDDLVFTLPARTAEMLRFDLGRAGIPFELDGERFDFHALRYESGSLLVSRGVNLKVVQLHMRHSTITLTMDRYARPQLHDVQSAAAMLPMFLSPPQLGQEQRATGTEGKETPQAPELKQRGPCPFQRPVQRPTFPRVPDSSRLDLPIVGSTAGATLTACSPALTSGFVNRRLRVRVPPLALDANAEASAACDPASPQNSKEAAALGAARDSSSENLQGLTAEDAAKIALLQSMIDELKKGAK